MSYFTRSKTVNEHRSAGVLPFALHDGAVLVLLGAEPCKTGPGGKVWRTMWRDFGGAREAADADSAATAAREFAEETMGLFGSCAVTEASVALAAAAMEARLHAPGQAVMVSHALKRGFYHFYITQQPYVSPLMFSLAAQQNAATQAVKGAEKSAFAWVPFRALLECVAECAPRYFLETRAHVCGGPGTPHAARGGKRRFQLHPCFATSLRMAQQSGLEELLARAQELPLDLPPALLPAAAVQQQQLQPLDPAGGVPDCAAGRQQEVAAGLPAAAAGACMGVQEAGAGCCLEEEAEGEGEDEEWDCSSHQGSHAQHESLAYWLTQEPIAAALRGSSSVGEAAAGHTAAVVAAEGQAGGTAGGGLPCRATLQLQQQAAPSTGDSGREQPRLSTAASAEAAAGWGGLPAGASIAQVPAGSGSSMGCGSSSIDTAGSLQRSRQAAAAAATRAVVDQIQQNNKKRHRLSRKQRQRLRRLRQREQEDAAAATAAAGGKRLAGSKEQQQQQQSTPQAVDTHSKAAAGVAATGDGDARTISGLPVADQKSPPAAAPHWRQAAAALEAAFEPRMLRLYKRQRLAVQG